MNSCPTVSVLNLCFNTGKRLIATLDSIAAQSYTDFEIIIIDDCSTDESVSILKKWMQDNKNITCRLHQNELNSGIPVSLNKAVSLSKGTYISIIGDDIWHKDLLSIQVPLLKNSSEKTGLVYSKCNCLEVKSNIITNEIDSLEIIHASGYAGIDQLIYKETDEVFRFRTPWLHHMLLKTNFVIVFTVLIKKAAIIKTGLFNEQYEIEDYPAWVKLSKEFEFLYVNKVLGTYMRYAGNFSTNSNFKVELNVLKVLVSSYSQELPKQDLFQLQNRIVTNIINGVKTSFYNRDVRLFFNCIKLAMRFALWPNLSTVKFLAKKTTGNRQAANYGKSNS